MPADADALVRQLQAIVDRLEIVLGELNEGIVWTDEIGRIQWCNDRFARLLDRTRAQLFDTLLLDVLPLENSDGSSEVERHPVKLALHTEMSATQIYRFRREKGEIVDLEIFWTGLPTLLDTQGALLVLRSRNKEISYCVPTRDALEGSTLYSILAEHSTDWICRQTLDGVLIYASPACQRLLGLNPEQAIGRSAFDLYHPDDAATIRQFYDRIARDPETPLTLSHRIRHDSEYYLWFETTFNAVRNPYGQVREVISVSRDVTDRLSYQKTLQRNEKRFRVLIENITDAILILDSRGLLRYVSPSAERLLGYASEAYVGQAPIQFVSEDDTNTVKRVFRRVLRRKGRCEYLVEFGVRHSDGRRLVFEATMTNLLDEPAIEGIVVNCHDITERKQAELQLRYDALHDALTGLPNRTLFMERLAQSIAQKKRHPDYNFAVLYLDLDRFKAVNDSLGHIAGDRLLVEVAKRLKSQIRYDDTVARLSGDEFAILLQDVTLEASAHQLADRLQRSLQDPLELNYQEVFVTASIGIVMASDLYHTPSDVLRDADTAMYRAKQLGKARQELFDTSMSQNNLKLLKLGVDLRHALDRRELELYYQPIVALESGQISGFEALLRWNHNELGCISPEEFIPIAEETGAIVPLGWWILDEACRQMQRWRKLFPEKSLVVCVNLSGRQFSQPSLVDRVAQTLAETKLEAKFLKLEITETTIVENAATVMETLQQFKHMGVQLSIDDFGTGYSSLSRLRSFPIDTLKIDKSFVRTMDVDRENLEITKSIVMLGQSLDISTIAEGVETPTHLAELRQLGCQYAQGYLFSRPVPAAKVNEIVASNPKW
ncbi:MAG: EAL domain-containing protein [Cyanobacteria bacterium SID2]|nr:EAL domain-containing protein [Cyanobacteria bacterium SID2]MBP0003311.1 EAL domain-containing protein [Cyanobacteria bacterium SBC]